LKGIIEQEGPVQVKRLFDIYLRSSGIKRMGHELRDTLLTALGTLRRDSVVFGHRYREEDDSLREIVWLVGKPSEVVRLRGDRTLEEIPLGELSAISSLVASRLNAIPGSESHLRSVLEVLDLKRLTSNAEIILGMAVRREFVAISDSSRQAN
jgi:hypothetical protein